MIDNSGQSSMQQYVEKNFLWNFTVNAMSVVFVTLALSLVSQSTILPLLVNELTGSKIAVGFIPAILSIGFLLPQLFTASHAESLRRKKPFIVFWSLIGDRSPYLVAAIAILLFAQKSPLLTIGLIYLCLLISSGTAGALSPAWNDMIAKVIPGNRRGIWMGVGSGGGAFLGIAGAALAGWFLTHFDFPLKYALCFFTAALFQFLCVGSLSLTREPESETVKEHNGLREYFKKLPAVLRRDKNYRIFLISRSVMNLGMMAAGFFIVYGSDHFGMSGAEVGGLTALLVGVQAVLNLALGAIGDRCGHNIVLMAGALAMALASLAALVWQASAAVWVIFILLGAALAADSVAGFSIILQFGAPEDRPTYIGLTNTLLAPARTISPIIGGWLASSLGYSWLFAVALAASIAGALMMGWWLKDPQHTHSD